MSNITYREDIEDITAPGLKLVTLLLYILPIPLIIIAFRDVIFILAFERADTQRWFIGASIEVMIAGFCWASATALHNLKNWAPRFVNLGLIFATVCLILYIFRDLEFFTLREVKVGFLIGLIVVLIMSILIISKNRDKFEN
ncbi:MAG: hypothetical protein GF364_22355 [Candidatus Lokiarchaeota archaeon]|nr:hypothetical protein [Candidatus Lokiarchaeota archaeon]